LPESVFSVIMPMGHAVIHWAQPIHLSVTLTTPVLRTLFSAPGTGQAARHRPHWTHTTGNWFTTWMADREGLCVLKWTSEHH